MKLHAYDAAQQYIDSAYRNAKNFHINKKMYSCSSKKMRQRIADDLKEFYKIGIEYPCVEKYRQCAMVNNSYHQKFEIVNYKKRQAVWDKTSAFSNLIRNIMMHLRISFIQKTNPELNTLANKYKNIISITD